MCPFAEQVFRSTYLTAVGSILLNTLNFLFYRLFKNITKFPVVVLGPRPMTLHAWLNKTSQNKKRWPLFSKNVLKIFPIHVYKFSFFNTLNTYRVFSIIIFDRVGDSRETVV